MNDILQSHGHKHRFVFMLVFSLILQMFTGVGVYAEALSPITLGGMNILVNEIIVKDNQGSEEEKQQVIGDSAENPITSGDKVNIYYKMKLTSCSEVATAEALTVIIPKEFKVGEGTSKISADTTDENGNAAKLEIGTCVISTQGQGNQAQTIGVIKFNENLKTQFDYANITIGIAGIAQVTGTPGEIKQDKTTFKVQGQSMNLPLYYKVPESAQEEDKTKPKLEKECTDFDEKTGELVWRITVTAGEETLKNVSVIDRFDKKQMAFKGQEVEDYKLPGFMFGEKYDGDFINLKGNISELAAGESVSILVKTLINDNVLKDKELNSKQLLTNTASLVDEMNTLLTKEAVATKEIEVQWISKGSKVTKLPNGMREIEWTVNINPNHVNLAGYKVLDKLPKGLKLNEETIKLHGSDGTAVKPTKVEELCGGSYTYKDILNSKPEYISYVKNGDTIKEYVTYIGQLQYQFPDVEDYKTYTLTYTTAVTDESYMDANKKVMFYNYAAIGNGIRPCLQYEYEGAGFASNMVKKKGAFNTTNHSISWKVTINENELELKDAKVTDEVIDRLKIDPNTFKVGIAGTDKYVKIGADPTKPTNVDGQVEAYYETAGQNLSVKFTKPIHKAYDVKFDTIIDSKYKVDYATNHTNSKDYRNVATFSANRDDISLVTTAAAVAYVDSKVISKQAVAYNYKTKEVKWLIVVNHNKMPITNAIVKEEISEGQHYADNSIKIVHGKWSYDEIKKAPPSSVVSYTLGAGSTDKVKYIEMGNINDIYSMIITTQLDEEYAKELFAKSGIKKIKNNATLYGEELPAEGQSVEAIQSINNDIIIKAGSQAMTNGPIKWTLTVNKNKTLLKNVVVTDKLIDTLELDTGSIHFYKMSVDEDGSIAMDKEVELTNNKDYKIDYNKDQNIIEFKFIKDIEECYQITFETEVTELEPKTSYTNTASIKGDGIDEGEPDSTAQVETKFITSGGSGGKERGSIEITKVDAVTGEILQGAEFELIDYNGYGQGNVKASDGKVIFKDLKLGKTYTIKEKVAPLGYAISSEPYEFQLSKKGEVLQEKFKNTKAGYNITFNKVDQHNKPVTGALFGLYDVLDQGAILASKESNNEGKVVFQNVTYGEYILKEISVSAEYKKSEASYRLVVNKDGTYVIRDEKNKEITQIINEKIEKPSIGGGGVTPEPTTKPEPTPTTKPEPTPTTKPEPTPTTKPEPTPTTKPEPTPISRPVGGGSSVVVKPLVPEKLPEKMPEKVPEKVPDYDSKNTSKLNKQEIEKAQQELESSIHGGSHKSNISEVTMSEDLKVADRNATLNGQDIYSLNYQNVNGEMLPKLGEKIQLRLIVLLGGALLLTGGSLLSDKKKSYRE